MILFALRCARDHEFEGWFRDGAAYDEQSAAGKIACPACASTEVEKAPMAPRLARSRQAEAPPSPETLRTALRELRRRIEANCDYVGEAFAEEARRIHHGEADPRAIYGEATKEEAESLADEGVEVSRIPWVPLNDA